MCDDLVIRSRLFEYSVRFSDDAGAELSDLIRPGDVALVDRVVLAAHEDRIGSPLSEIAVVPVAASEANKSFERIGETLASVVEAGLRRNNRLIAIGGGVVQDIVAFMATTLYRGVDWVFVPTTLLAQGDSCIGGKSSVNFRGYKNLLGSFLPPRQIVVDVAFLRTLPEPQVRSGVGEILHFLIYDGEEQFAFLESNATQIRTDPEKLRQLTRRSLVIKAAVVEEDEFDQGHRQLFNYGHSFGHAIEAVTSYEIPHGIAVSMGIDIANFLSVELGHASPAFRNRVRAVASGLWRGYSIQDLPLDAFFEALRRDKKNVGSDVIVILTSGMGGLFKTPIDLEGDAGEALERYIRDEAP